MATRTWSAAGAGNASVAENWSDSTAPVSGDSVVFDNTSDQNCSWNLDAATVTVKGLSMATGHDGTVTQAATADVGIGTDGVSLVAGVFAPSASKYVLCAGNFTHTQSAALSNLNLKLTTDGTAFSSNIGATSTLRTLYADANCSVALSFQTMNLITSLGKALSIASTKTFALKWFKASTTFTNNGAINGPGTFSIISYDADKTIVPGIINAPVTIPGKSDQTANRILTMGATPYFGSTVAVSSAHASNTMTLDFAGRNSYIQGNVTSGTRGNILWGEGVHHLAGNLDTSAGATNFETSQIVMTNGGTIKTAAAQPLYDLITYAKVITLESDITISNIFAHVGPVNLNGHTITMTDPQKEYTGMKRPIRRALTSPVMLPPCCCPLLDGIERATI
jgi:hypothetical protein